MQKVYQQEQWVDFIKEELLRLVPENRTCFGELPVIYHELLLTQWEKEAWCKDFYRRHSDLF